MRGTDWIKAARDRQIQLGYTPEHDQEEHRRNELAKAAFAYLYLCRLQLNRPLSEQDIRETKFAYWPWPDGWKPSQDDVVQNLAKAGALIAAEIDLILGTRGAKGA